MIYSADYVTIEDESFEHSHNGFSTYLIIIYMKNNNCYLGGRQYAKGDLWIIDDSIINHIICNHVEISDNWLSQQDNQTLNPYYIRMLLLLQQWKLSNTSAMWKSNKDPWLGFKVPTTLKSLDTRNQTRILDY
jgi:hypothetical protein